MKRSLAISLLALSSASASSFIPIAEAEGPFAVTAYEADLLRRLGAHTPAEGLRLDPSFVGNTPTENDSNGGNGTARLSLRGLGPDNTLTLINGRRAFAFANLNAIPLGALDRAEVLRDGAGHLYGADAVGGTVNLILINGHGSTPLNGFEVDLLYGNTTDKDARVLQGAVRGGFSNEKLSLAFAAEYYDREAIFSRDPSPNRPSGARCPTDVVRVAVGTSFARPKLRGGRIAGCLDVRRSLGPAGAGPYR